MWIWIAVGFVTLIAGTFVGAAISSWQTPQLPGLVDGRLPPCPNKPNCVCSGDTDSEHGIEPLAIAGDVDTAWTRLQTVMAAFPSTVKIGEQPNYLRYACSTSVMRFTDDVEFQLDRAASCIHVRSASRAGYSDMGANRKRVSEIRTRFAAASNQTK